MIPGLVPVGSIIAWAKSFTSVPSLATQGRTEYVECNGQTLSDAQSLLTGNVIPNLNNSGGAAANRFLRGNTTSGGTGGSLTATGSTSSATAAISSTLVNVDGNLDAITVSVVCSVIDSGHSHVATTVGVLPQYYDVVYLMRVK